MLDPPPWSEENIRDAYFYNRKSLDEALENHQGRSYYLEMDRIKKGVKIFEKAIEEYDEIISSYKQELDKESIPTRRTQGKFDQFDLKLCMRVIMASVAAKNVVDYSRRSRQILAVIPNFDDMRKHVFSGDPPHEFFQDLRNYALHFDLPAPEWEGRCIWHDDIRGKEEKISLFIHSQKFLEYKNWNSASRAFLLRTERIELEGLFSPYKKQLACFNQWLLTCIEKAAGEDIQDYRRSVEVVEKIRWHCRLAITISRIDLNGNNFLGAFHEHLTEQEIAELESYPNYSDKQLGRLRELLNIYGAFDDELYENLQKKMRPSMSI